MPSIQAARYAAAILSGAVFAAMAAPSPDDAGWRELARPGADAPAVPERECDTRVNDTERKLLECIQRDALWRHLEAFQRISDDHPGPDGHGSRDTGTAGYRASVDYVAGLMRRAGYRVTVQAYPYQAARVEGQPRLAVGGRALVQGRDWAVAHLSGGGAVSAKAMAAGGTGSGCSAAELAAFVPGRVALLARGACGLDAQVANAQAAGAAAVLLHDPDADPRGPRPARLHHAARIPVLGYLSPSAVQALAAGDAAVELEVRLETVSGEDYNLIADSPWGDPGQVVVAEGHLDSIFGAGILDNASGSATLIEIALKMARTPTRNQLRYVWFGGEELGLLGSAWYVRHLAPDELRRIAFDVDADVTATPNFDYLVADPARAHNVADFPPDVVPRSRLGNRLFAQFFEAAGVPARPAWFGNDGTDSNSFSLAGVPNTGILTMQDCCKKSWEVQVWGGSRGNYEGQVPGFDGGCVDLPRRWCDNLPNNDAQVLQLASRAAAFVVFGLAFHDFGGAAR